MSSNPLTVTRLHELLHYDQVTGVFTWRVKRRSVNAGDVAGKLESNGYRRVKIDGRQRMAARLAWLYVTGTWPTAQVDHEDGDRGNDIFSNLREATHAENQQNRPALNTNTSGFKGVHKSRDKWRARIRANSMDYGLGTFSTPEEAHAAYCRAAAELHGAFACTVKLFADQGAS